MIAANELRIGNWVHSGGKKPKQITVEDFWSHYDNQDKKDRFYYYEYIPLTPEILEKAGFVKADDGISPFHKLVISRTEVISIEDDFSFGLNGENENSSQGYASGPELCKYVHQLQNLFFALTGQELEIKL